MYPYAILSIQQNCDLPSQYFCELAEETKKRYEDKIKLVGFAQDPYYCLENPKAKVDGVLEWNHWPDYLWPDVSKKWTGYCFKIEGSAAH